MSLINIDVNCLILGKYNSFSNKNRQSLASHERGIVIIRVPNDKTIGDNSFELHT